MNFAELKNEMQITVEGVQKIDGVVIPAEVVKTTLYGRIYNSAQVVKNKRESVNTSAKATVAQALQMELITTEEAIPLLLVGDKTKIAELREQMPQCEKSKDPNEGDIELAKRQFLGNGGQRA